MDTASTSTSSTAPKIKRMVYKTYERKSLGYALISHIARMSGRFRASNKTNGRIDLSLEEADSIVKAWKADRKKIARLEKKIGKRAGL